MTIAVPTSMPRLHGGRQRRQRSETSTRLLQARSVWWPQSAHGAGAAEAAHRPAPASHTRHDTAPARAPVAPVERRAEAQLHEEGEEVHAHIQPRQQALAVGGRCALPGRNGDEGLHSRGRAPVGAARLLARVRWRVHTAAGEPCCATSTIQQARRAWQMAMIDTTAVSMPSAGCWKKRPGAWGAAAARPPSSAATPVPSVEGRPRPPWLPAPPALSPSSSSAPPAAPLPMARTRAEVPQRFAGPRARGGRREELSSRRSTQGGRGGG